MSTCYDCMYLRRDWKKEKLFVTYFMCTRFGQWVKADSPSCDAYTARTRGAEGCYLTTACTEYRGLPDNCEELTILRSFRDSYLKGTEEGARMVQEYYRFAPDLAEKIKRCPDRDQIFADLYETIVKCVSLIKAGKFDETVQLYSQTALALKKQFCEEEPS